MRTSRTLTVFQWRPPEKLETPRKIGGIPPGNLEDPPNIWRNPPGPDPPPCEQNHTRLWKYYLGQNFVSAGNKTVCVILVPIIKYYLYTCQRWRVYILFVLLKNLPDSTEYFWSFLHIVIILLITSFPRREDCKILYYSVLSSVTGFVIYPFVFCNLPLSWMWNQCHTCQWQVEQFSSYRKDEDTKQSLRWNHQ